MSITAGSLQAALGQNAMNELVVMAGATLVPGTSTQEWYVRGGVNEKGRARWVVTDANEGDVTQASSVISALSTQWL